MSNKRGVSLDAERMGELAVVLADYRTKINMELPDIMGDEELLLEAMDTCYYIGAIEARLLANNLSKDEYELLEAWEKELYAEEKRSVHVMAIFETEVTDDTFGGVLDDTARLLGEAGFHIEFIGEHPFK